MQAMWKLHLRFKKKNVFKSSTVSLCVCVCVCIPIMKLWCLYFDFKICAVHFEPWDGAVQPQGTPSPGEALAQWHLLWERSHVLPHNHLPTCPLVWGKRSHRVGFVTVCMPNWNTNTCVCVCVCVRVHYGIFWMDDVTNYGGYKVCILRF